MKIINITAAAIAALSLTACNNVQVSGEVSAETQAVLDRIAIEDMVVGYYAHLGSDEAGAFGDYFAPDAVFDVNGIVATGPEEINALYASMSDGDNNLAEAGIFHMVLSNPVIEVDGDTATAQFIWTGVLNADIAGAPHISEQGREYDQLVRQDGKWLFQHRVVIADSGLPDAYAETYTPRLNFSF